MRIRDPDSFWPWIQDGKNSDEVGRYARYLEKSPEGSAADGTVVGLVAQGVRTGVAEAEVAARQDDRVPGVAHAHHALRSWHPSIKSKSINYISQKNLVSKWINNIGYLHHQIKSSPNQIQSKSINNISQENYIIKPNPVEIN